MGGYGRFVRLWDVGTAELLHELDRGLAGRTSLEFSPDGRYLATVGTLWDVATGVRIGPDLAAGLPTSMTDLSSDGHHLLVTTADGRARHLGRRPGVMADCGLARSPTAR